MPIYEYRCEQCNAEFEQLVFSSSQADSVSCVQCGSSKVQRKVSSIASAGTSHGSSLGSFGGCGSGGFT